MPDSSRLIIEAASPSHVELDWLRAVALPERTRVDYGAIGSRGDFVITVGRTELAAVCDLESGEYVITSRSGDDPLAAALLRSLLSQRLRHLRDLPVTARRRLEGGLKILAEMTGGDWYSYETVRDA